MSYPQVQDNQLLSECEYADDGDEILNSESKVNMMKIPVRPDLHRPMTAHPSVRDSGFHGNFHLSTGP